MTPAAVSAGDTAWLIVATALVMLMVPGLALFYGGLVRGRSVLNTMMMSLAALGLVGVQWVLLGYSLSFGTNTPYFGNLGWMGFGGVTSAPNATYSPLVPHLLFAAFQGMFAAITVALISGAVVERMRFGAYLLFVLLWTTLVYDPLAHWVWADGGWLRSLGALDFAGGTVVHISAGVSALVAAVFIGKRRDVGRAALVPHNVPFTLLGAGVLWFGWFGFNGGSALAADGLAATALVTTHSAAAAALTMWVLLDLLRTRRSTAVGAATGAVAGLVAITPAAGFVTPASALVIGAAGASLSHAAIQLRARTGVDDALDVFACHGVAGIAGALLTGVFASKAVNPLANDGLLLGNPGLLGVQALAVGATVVFAGVLSLGILGALRLVMPLRVPVSDEIAGIDMMEHGEEGYHGGDAGALASRPLAIGDSVLIPAGELSAVRAAHDRATAGR